MGASTRPLLEPFLLIRNSSCGCNLVEDDLGNERLGTDGACVKKLPAVDEIGVPQEEIALWLAAGPASVAIPMRTGMSR
jgi:hypothetical protein